MRLISTINFRLNYETHSVYFEPIGKLFFPKLMENESSEDCKKLFKHYYYMSYHSLWTQVDMFFSPVAVAVSCLKVAVAEVNAIHSLKLIFDDAKLCKCNVTKKDVENVCKILTFGNLHKPGEKSQHDKIIPVDMNEFRPRYGPQCNVQNYRTDSPEAENSSALLNRVSNSDNFVVLIKDGPSYIKHQDALQRSLGDEQISWCKFILKENDKIDMFVFFKHWKSIIELIKQKTFLEINETEIKVKFKKQTCKGVIDHIDDIGVKEVKIDEKGTVFVGNLDKNAYEDDLLRAFTNFGEIVSVKIPRSFDDRRANKYGFVNFKSEKSKNKALKSKIFVRRRQLDLFSRQTGELERVDKFRFGVMIDGVSFNTVDEFELIGAFAKFGEICAVCVLRNTKNALRITDVAFVFFNTEEAQKTALKNPKSVDIGIPVGKATIGTLKFSTELIRKSKARFPVVITGIKPNSSLLDLKHSLAICENLYKSKLLYDSFNPKDNSLSGYALFSTKESQKLAIEMKNVFVKKNRVKVTFPGPLENAGIKVNGSVGEKRKLQN